MNQHIYILSKLDLNEQINSEMTELNNSNFEPGNRLERNKSFIIGG